VQLTALVTTPQHVCCRYRIAAFRPFLAEAGWHVELRPLPRNWWEWLRLPRELRQADAVVLLRKLLHPWQLHLVRRSARRLIYDVDDAIFLRDSYSAKGFHSSHRRRRFQSVTSAADAVVAGNAFLQENAFQASGRDHVEVIPTCVNPALYPLARHERKADGVQLVWIGSSSTLQGLEATRSMLEGLGEAVLGLALKIICDRFLGLDHLPVLACPWSEATEGADLAAADIGISWLPEDRWSRGKCGLKVLQYMAAGLPVIANPVGVQAEIVRHGETGFLAESLPQWIEAVRRLANDPELRRRLGEAGRRRVEAAYSVTAGAGKWLALLQRLHQREEAA
jgi:glycosyltransferase involved in cell wall biosynthesis